MLHLIPILKAPRGSQGWRPREAPGSPVLTPREELLKVCAELLVSPRRGAFGLFLKRRERDKESDMGWARYVMERVFQVGFLKADIMKVLLAQPLERNWEAVGLLLSAWNEVASQQQISLEELKKAKGVVEEVQANVATRVRRHTGGHR